MVVRHRRTFTFVRRSGRSPGRPEREQQRHRGQDHAHRRRVAELALGEGRGEQLLGHDQRRVLRAAAGVQRLHVDEGVEGGDAEIDVRRLHVVPDQRHGDEHRGTEPAGAVDPGGLEHLGGMPLMAAMNSTM